MAAEGKHHFVVCDPRALPYATDIDRRGSTRKVPMEILVLGKATCACDASIHALIRVS